MDEGGWWRGGRCTAYSERGGSSPSGPGRGGCWLPSLTVPHCTAAQGEGTVLHLASLFESDEDPLPPVMSFSMGTLGFLTPFDVNHYERLLTR